MVRVTCIAYTDRVTCIAYTERVSCVDYAAHAACSASNVLLSFPHINNSRPRHGESSKGPMTPTLPTTIQAGPDATHDETDYHLLIFRMDTLLISPELLCLRHPTLYQHHPYMLALTSCRDAHPGRPYLAVFCAQLGHITRPIAGQYCAT